MKLFLYRVFNVACDSFHYGCNRPDYHNRLMVGQQPVVGLLASTFMGTYLSCSFASKGKGNRTRKH